MTSKVADIYKGWSITVTAESSMCSNFSFDIISPAGQSQHVKLGGDNEESALKRAREMIDMECALAEDE